MNLDDQAGIPPIPEELPVLPIRGAVVFPLAMVPIAVGQERSIELVEDVVKGDRLVALVTQSNEDASPAEPQDLYRVGTSGIIRQYHRTPAGTYNLVVQGIGRVRFEEFVQTVPYMVARIRQAPETPVIAGPMGDALVRTAKDLFGKVASLTPDLPDELALAMLAFDDPLQVSYLLSTTLPLAIEVRQELLEIDSVSQRLERLIELMQQEISVRELEQKIVDETKVRISDTQREYVLRERLHAIQRELGEEGGEVADLRKRLSELRLPEEARREAERELGRLERIPDVSPEHGMIRSYLDWLLSVPWGKTTGGPIDLVKAREILDRDHYDLDKIKDRIIENLAVKKLRQERGLDQPGVADEAAPGKKGGEAGGEQPKADGAAGARPKADGAAGPRPEVGARPEAGPRPEGAEAPSSEGGPSPRPNGPAQEPERPRGEVRREPILCFVGPPGTGKTSLGQSIARALGRKFAHASLGGIQDEAEIRGHRRTYIGSMPGRIVQALRRAGVSDPIFMLDEVDKLGVGFHGDPSAALLEVLDPAQNHAFVDTYLGVPVDLSQVLFICTANTTESIPAPLLDRMEVVRLSGYTDEEKVQIARRHLLPAQIASTGLREGEVVIDEPTIRRVIRDYTREAGVRNLERELASILRKSAKRISEGEEGPIEVRPEDLHDFLGPRRFFDEAAERIDRPGISTGMAWTPAGGDIIFVEAAMMPGRKEELILTGTLGNVMRESAQAALTWVRSNAEGLGVEPRKLLRKTFHVHVPAGAIPKDGPSAGVAILVALVSLVTGKVVRQDVAMTGEITLRGKVLPVGGIRDKVLGAHRAGIHTVMIPRHNLGALEEVPEEVRDALDVVPLDTAEDALLGAFEEARPPVEEGAPPLM